MSKRKLLNYNKLYSSLNLLDKVFIYTCCYYPDSEQALRKYNEKPEVELQIETNYKKLKSIYNQDLFLVKTDLKVLDFGCGEGFHALALGLNHPNFIVEGIDIQHRFKAVEKYVDENGIKNVKYTLGSTKEAASNSYDVILSHDAFEHFENPFEILEEMHRLLKPGGKLYLKFGPIWKGPYGRHLTGMIRKDRPWIHLFISEKRLMRVYSYLAGLDTFLTKYKEIPGGMNQMTIKKFLQLTKKSEFKLNSYKKYTAISARLKVLSRFKLTQEYFTSGISAVLTKT